MKLVLPFEDTFPDRYSRYFQDHSPEVKFEDVPDEAETLALIMDDPDAKPVAGKVWDHWVIWNIPVGEELPENLEREGRLENGAVQGTSDYGEIGYGGPKPPEGTHTYRFRAYALDTGLNLGPGATKEELLNAMEGHVLAEDQVEADCSPPE